MQTSLLVLCQVQSKRITFETTVQVQIGARRTDENRMRVKHPEETPKVRGEAQ